MLKRKNKNKDRKVSKSQLIIVGSLLIVVGIGIVGGKYLYNYLQNQNEENLIDTFYEEQKEITDETTPENKATNIPAAPNLEKSTIAPASVNSGRINIMNKQRELNPAKIFFLSNFFFSMI